MAVIGTFGSFTTARLGIYASQASLQVTGNNIANINTKGYTRQRADLVSLNSTGTSHYANPMGVDIGYGVLVKSTTQLRDPYLDIRFRNQNTQLGEINATLAGLNKISQTLDEVNKGSYQNGVIEDCLQTFKTMLQKLSVNVGSEEYDSLVRESAQSLVTFFNTAADKLQTDWDLQADELGDSVKDVNTCLTNIRNLNEQIRKQGIYGDLALELRDARNLEIDKLSEYMGINVEYSMERIDQYTEVEKLTITLKDTQDPKTGQPIKLIDGLYGAQLSFSDVEVNPNYNANEKNMVKCNPNYDKNAAAGDPNSFKYLKANGDGTNDITEAEILIYDKANNEYKDAAGATITDYTVASLKYLDANGLQTDNIEDAAKVNANTFLLQVERLEDKFGRPLDEGRGTESVTVPLSDTDLTGSLQAMRELLTEEGEFASKKDVGLDNNSAVLDPDDPANYSALRASDADASTKKGIPYYQKRLDLLAKKFAEIFNEANQLPASTVYVTNPNGEFVDKAGNALEYPAGTKITLDTVTEEVDVYDEKGNQVFEEDGITPVKKRIPLNTEEAAKALEVIRAADNKNEEYKFYDGGVLFSNNGNNNDPSGITANNISIANSWATRTVRVLNKTTPDEKDNSTDETIDHSSENANIRHMITLFEKELNYSAKEIEADAAVGDQIFFHGSFQEMYTDLGATLGIQASITTGISNNYELMALDMDNDRLSVSGVDLNDEATSMMQFQKSYQAACRLLTTIDSMLDTLINNTIR